MFETFINTITELFCGVLRMIGMMPPLVDQVDIDKKDSTTERDDLLRIVDEMNSTIGQINLGKKEKNLLCRFRTYVNACVLTVIYSADHEIVYDAMDRLSTMRERLKEQYNVIVGLIPSVDDCVNRIISLSQLIVRTKEEEYREQSKEKIINETE